MHLRLFPELYKLSFFAALVFVFCCLPLLSGCRTQTPESERMKDFPPVVLWAWERPENLDFIDPKRHGVAFLAQTLELSGEEVSIRSRRQPLVVPPGAFVIPVTRIESDKRNSPSLSDGQRKKIVAAILKTTETARAVQIDFDAAAGEREFYREILRELRTVLPADFAISITALASFCIGDAWIADLPVDEAVPMIFRMGADEKNVRAFLANGNDFSVPLCRTSYGIATDEPLKINYETGRRIYAFNVKPWRREDLELLPEAARR